MMKRIIPGFINAAIVVNIIIIAFFLKTGGFSVCLGKETLLACQHIRNLLIPFLFLWAVRLILVRGRPPVIQPLFSIKRKNIILALLILYWLALRLILQEPGAFSLYLPHFDYTFNPVVIFIASTALLLCIAYYIYLLTAGSFGISAGVIAVSVFLFSPLSRISTGALFPAYIIILLLSGSAVYFTGYPGRNKPRRTNLVISLCFLGAALLFKIFFLKAEFNIQGLWDLRVFERRLITAMPLSGNLLLWVSAGIILCLWKRRLFLVFLFIIVSLWTFFIAFNNTLAVYLPLTCFLSIFAGAFLGRLLENRFTNRTIFDRNISFSSAAVLLVLFYFNTAGILNHLPGRSSYEAEDLPHYGRVIADKNASGGRAVLKNKEEAKTEPMVIFGPYDPFLCGEYEATFRLLTEDNTAAGPVAGIDAASAYGDLIFALKKIRGTDFKHRNSYQDFSVRFYLRKSHPLEFRVVSYGQADITVDKVSLRPLDRNQLISAPRYIPILMYHKIGEHAPTEWWVKKDAFRQQMKKLRKAGYKTIHIKDIYNYKMKKGGLPFHPVVITFDDGYENFLTLAFPVLKKYGLTATVFIITGTAADTEDNRTDNAWDNEAESGYKARHLTWPEIQRLNREGMEIGSHTKTHPNLTRLEKAGLEKEIKESKSILEEKLGAPVEVFSYPGGKRNSLVIETVKEAGYKAAVTVTQGVEDSENPDLFNLKRIYVGPKEDAGKVLRKIAERH